MVSIIIAFALEAGSIPFLGWWSVGIIVLTAFIIALYMYWVGYKEWLEKKDLVTGHLLEFTKELLYSKQVEGFIPTQLSEDERLPDKLKPNINKDSFLARFTENTRRQMDAIFNPQEPQSEPQQVESISSDALYQYKIDRLKELIGQHEAFWTKTHMPVKEITMFKSAFDPRVKKFLREYFNDSYAQRFNAKGIEVLEEILLEQLKQNSPKALREKQTEPEKDMPSIMFSEFGYPTIQPDGYGVFNKTNEISTEDNNVSQAMTIEFRNEVIAGREIATADNVQAQIFFYDSNSGLRQHEILEGVWIGEQSSVVRFERSNPKELLLLIAIDGQSVVAVDNKRGVDGYRIAQSPFINFGSLDIYICLTFGEEGSRIRTFKFQLEQAQHNIYHSLKFVGEEPLPSDSAARFN